MNAVFAFFAMPKITITENSKLILLNDNIRATVDNLRIFPAGLSRKISVRNNYHIAMSHLAQRL